jgi:hypothetical protein
VTFTVVTSLLSKGLPIPYDKINFKPASRLLTSGISLPSLAQVS